MSHCVGRIPSAVVVAITFFATTSATFADSIITSNNACSGSPQGTVKSFISDLYGSDGIRLAQAAGHDAHFCANATSALANLGDLIGASISTFSSFSSSDSNPSFEGERSLGPLAGERAVTVGQGAFHVGFATANVKFESLNGSPLSEQRLEFAHIDTSPRGVGAGFPNPTFENDVVVSDLDISIEQDVYAFTATYGVLDNLDVGLVIPIVSVDASVTARARVEERGGAGLHTPGIESLFDSNSVSATGLGDVVLRTKYLISDDGAIPFIGPRGLDVALLGQVSVPSGDEDDLLGSGETQVKGMFIAGTSQNRFNPIINVGYEHYFSDDFERSNVNYVVGMDVRASSHLTIAAEVLGRYEIDDDGFTDPSYRIPDLRNVAVADREAALTPGNLDDEHRVDFSIGVKWVPFREIPLRGNVIIPINKDTGLRPDYILTLGIESSF